MNLALISMRGFLFGQIVGVGSILTDILTTSTHCLASSDTIIGLTTVTCALPF